MSIQRRPKKGQPLPDGWKKPKWVVRYRDPAGKEHSRTFTTEKAAKDFDRDQARLLARNEWVDTDHAPTLGDLWPTWAALATTPGTRAVRDRVGKNLGDMAGMKITDLRPTILRQWQTHLREGRPWVTGCTGLAPNTISSWWTQLSGCLHMAVTDEMLLVNPCTKIPGPGTGTGPVEPRTLPTTQQVRDTIERLDATGRDTLTTMIILALSTGMRPAEVGGLRWQNVDRKAGTIHVIEQTTQHPAKGSSGWAPPKTKSSRRIVPVPSETMNRLREHRLRHPADAGDAMFRTATGLLWTSDRIKHALDMVADGWTFHALRHVFATRMLSSGRSVKAVQRVLGHSSASTTMDTYWHFLPEEEDLVRGSASELVRDVCGMEPGGLTVRPVGGENGNPV